MRRRLVGTAHRAPPSWRRGTGGGARAGRRHAGEATGDADASREPAQRRLRDQPDHGRADLSPPRPRRPHPRLQREALDLRGGARDPRPGWRPRPPPRWPGERRPVAGVLRGNLYLRGAGDPTLSSARLEVLAQNLADAGLTRVTGRVVGDESAFDRRRGVPLGRGIGADVGGPLGALVVDRGARQQPTPPSRPSYAAEVLARELRDAGVKVSRKGRLGQAPADAWRCGVADSAERRAADPRDERAVGQLHRRDAAQGGRATGRAGTTAAARARRTCWPTARHHAAHPRRLRPLARATARRPREVVGCSPRWSTTRRSTARSP